MLTSRCIDRPIRPLFPEGWRYESQIIALVLSADNENDTDVLAITGDHSTPCVMKGHSWHPQPVLLSSAYSGSDKLERFTETGANTGSLGLFEAKYLLRLMQANAKMFDKFGA